MEKETIFGKAGRKVTYLDLICFKLPSLTGNDCPL